MAGSNFIVPPHDATGSAARSAIAFLFRAFIDQIPAAQQGDVEAIHQARIATRRLRAAVRLFSPYISSIKPKNLDQRLKWISERAGTVRDLDVLEKLTAKQVRKLEPWIASDLAPLLEEIRSRRKKALDDLAASLASTRYKSLVARLSAPIAITAEGDAAFAAVAGQLLAPTLKAMLRAGEKMHEEPTPDDLHYLRKCAKWFRYTLEMMLGVGDEQLRGVLRRIEELQGLLGEYHDAAVAVEWVRTFANSPQVPLNVAFGCGALSESIKRREQKLKRRALKEWRRFARTDAERRVKKAFEKIQPKGASSDDALHHAPRTR